MKTRTTTLAILASSSLIVLVTSACAPTSEGGGGVGGAGGAGSGGGPTDCLTCRQPGSDMQWTPDGTLCVHGIAWRFCGGFGLGVDAEGEPSPCIPLPRGDEQCTESVCALAGLPECEATPEWSVRGGVPAPTDLPAKSVAILASAAASRDTVPIARVAAEAIAPYKDSIQEKQLP